MGDFPLFFERRGLSTQAGLEVTGGILTIVGNSDGHIDTTMEGSTANWWKRDNEALS